MISASNIVVIYCCIFSLLSSNFNITIGSMIGTPGYGKYIIDVINSCDTRYRKEKMCIVWTPKVEDSITIMEAHAMIGDSKLSWVITYKKL